MSDQKINYAYKDYQFFHTRFSCTCEAVEEEFFQECMEIPQALRPECEGIKAKAVCEACDFFGREAWVEAPETGEIVMQDNGLGKELAK